MLNKTLEHVRRLFQAHAELAEALPEDAFDQKLGIRSNTIGGQFWCVIGARESYTRALERGAWSGFACSLTSETARNKQEVIQALKRATAAFDEVLSGLSWTDAREHLLLDLLEHETQHQGQLIRYVYGLGYTFPDSWAKRWALSD